GIVNDNCPGCITLLPIRFPAGTRPLSATWNPGSGVGQRGGPCPLPLPGTERRLVYADGATRARRTPAATLVARSLATALAVGQRASTTEPVATRGARGLRLQRTAHSPAREH